jgi:hypothetical protein
MGKTLALARVEPRLVIAGLLAEGTALVLFWALPAAARPNGLAVSDCTGCHPGVETPTLGLDFDPPEPEPGQSVTLTLSVSSPSIAAAGFFMQAPELGQLHAIAGQPTTVSLAGATHNSPIAASGGSAQVELQWTAPMEPGGTVFTVAALAANADGKSTGDSAAYAKFGLVWGCEGLTLYRDNDGDGIGAASFGTSPGCEPNGHWVASDGDCDENDPEVHPSATEVCNEKDDDCNGVVDEGTSPRLVYPDADGDGFGAVGGESLEACALPNGYADNAEDCDDSNIEVHPGALEVCNGLDDDCNQQTDEGAKKRCGIGWCERLAPSCADDSCVPGEPSPEQCNGVDDDCDGDIDEDAVCASGSSCRDGACHPRDGAEPISSDRSDPEPPPAGTATDAETSVAPSSTPTLPGIAAASGGVPSAAPAGAPDFTAGSTASGPAAPSGRSGNATPAVISSAQCPNAPNIGATPATLGSGCALAASHSTRGTRHVLLALAAMVASVFRSRSSKVRFRREPLARYGG